MTPWAEGVARAAGGDSGPLPEVVEVQLPSAGVVSLTVNALASGKLKPARRSGQKGSMANLEEAGPAQGPRPPLRWSRTAWQTWGGSGAPWEHCLAPASVGEGSPHHGGHSQP